MTSELAGHAPRVPVAVVPTAPLLLPAVSPRQPGTVSDAVADLRTAVTATLQALPTDTVVAIAVGSRPAVHLGTRVDRTGSGHPQATTSVATDPEAAADLAAAIGFDLDGDEVLRDDLGVLAALVAGARPSAAVVAVSVAAATDPVAVAHDLGTWAARHGAAVVAAGDLAATRESTSPGYVVEGAVAFDDAVVAALRAGDAASLYALGAREADRVQARAWVPLVIAATVAAAPFAQVDLVAPRGVGQVVARTTMS